MNYKKRFLTIAFALTLCGATILTGCAKSANDEVYEVEDDVVETSGYRNIADASETVEAEDVVQPWMTSIYAKDIKDGTYDIDVDSSSKMFNIESCELTVSGDEMTASMTMGGTGYRCLFLGTGAEAAEIASEDAYVFPEENEEGKHVFTVPVTALNEGINCAAFSNKKTQWYDRVLVFRADSLTAEDYEEGVVKLASDLGLDDGEYEMPVVLSGGSGKASIDNPAKVTIDGAKATALIVWSSPNYDYMIVGGEKYLPTNTDGNSTFEIPVEYFDFPMTVLADTVAMSESHEIQYTLIFNTK